MKIMRSSLKITIIVCMTLAGTLLIGNETSAVDACQIKSFTNLKNRTFTTGRDVVDIQVVGNGCVATPPWEGSINIYEVDTGPDDLIRTIPFTFQAAQVSGGDSAANVSFKFTNDDYARGDDERPSEQMYIEVAVGTQEVLNETDIFTVLPPTTLPTDCKLTSTSWVEQTAVVGQKVRMRAVGENCNGWEVAFNIYDFDGASNDYITTVRKHFGASPTTTVIAEYTFTAGDYVKGTGGPEGGELELYIEAVAGSSTIRSTSNMALKEGVAGNCQLSTAQWRWTFRAQPIVGSTVQLVVNGANCAGGFAGIDLYERDTGLVDDKYPARLTAQFNTAGTQAVVNWIVDGTWDDDNIGSYEFYFEAAAGNAKVTSGVLNNTSGIPLRSQNGCLNCNAVLAPSTCQCADGFSGDRSLAGTCDAVCKDHIGDAKTSSGGGGTGGGGTGGSGGGGTGGGSGGGSGTASQSYVFNLTNPLCTDNSCPETIFDVLDIITRWMLRIAIPLAVIFILYAGFLFLTAGPYPNNINKARDILKWTVVGLAIIFIGRGFITLIFSIIDLGGDGSGQEQQNTPTSGSASGVLGNACQQDSQCSTGLRCKGTSTEKICQYPNGNGNGEPCLANGNNCLQGYTCNMTNAKQVDGQMIGECRVNGGIGDFCQRDNNCLSGLKCNEICQRRDGNEFGEFCVSDANPSNCKSNACATSQGSDYGTCR